MTQIPMLMGHVIKDISIQDLGNQYQWPRDRITTKTGVHALVAMGRCIVDPCSQCEFAGDTGVGDYCGSCRSRDYDYQA